MERENKDKVEIVITEGEVFFYNEWRKVRHSKNGTTEVYMNGEWIDTWKMPLEWTMKGFEYKRGYLKAVKEYNKKYAPSCCED